MDLTIGSYYIVPTDLVVFLEAIADIQVEVYKQSLTMEELLVITEYLSFLIDNNLGTYLTHEQYKNLLPYLLIDDYARELTNVVIELPLSEQLEGKLFGFFKNTDIIACQLISFAQLEIGYLEKIVKQISSLDVFQEIQIIIPYSEQCNEESLKIICHSTIEVTSITITNSPFNKLAKLEDSATCIMFSQSIISSCMDCGKVSQDYFTVSFAFFNEGTHRNTCLNGKIAIDQNGNVRNCLTSLKQYGNIKSHKLQALLNDDFSRLWKLTKTDITKCKACEFRMMCPDCRVVAENTEDIYSPPLNCKYDPFTATWAS